MVRAGVVVCLLSACGRLGFDGEPQPDVPPVDAPPCTEPWSLPTEIATGLASPLYPSITADGLEMYVNEAGSGDLFVMQRARVEDSFGPAVVLSTPPNTPFIDSSASISADGLDLYFTTLRMGNAFFNVSHRASRQAAFETALHSGAFGGGDVASDGLALYSQDYMAPIGRWTRATTADTFGSFAELESVINDGSMNTEPSISFDGRDLYFISTRSAVMEMWVAKRPDPTGPFLTVERIPLVLPVGTSDPGSPEISADGRALYFTVRDPGTVYRLLVSTRCE